MLDSFQDLPVLVELDLKDTVEELSKAIEVLPSKAVDVDGIPSEMIKCRNSVPLEPLYELLLLFREWARSLGKWTMQK